MDGRREDSGRGVMGVTGAMIRARIRVDRRLAGGLGAPMAVCLWDKMRTEDAQEALARELAGTFSWPDGGSVANGRRRHANGSNRARARLTFLAPVRMEGEAAGRAGDSSGEGEEPPPLGGHRSPRPMPVQRARLWAITWTASQAALAAKRPEGRWLSPTPYFRSRMALDLGVAAVVGLQFQGLPVPVGDEAVIAVGGAPWAFTRRT